MKSIQKQYHFVETFQNYNNNCFLHMPSNKTKAQYKNTHKHWFKKLMQAIWKIYHNVFEI